MKIFIIVDRGCVAGVYADSKQVDVEVIDLDDVNDEKEADLAGQRAEQVAAEYAQVA